MKPLFGNISIFLLLLVMNQFVTAETYKNSDSIQDIVWGGMLYDKWWKVLGVDAPKQKHPAYPSIGSAKDSNSWRCKECHGWDYQGKEGAYATGSHATGIIGIQSLANADVTNIQTILTNKTHQYDRVMPESALKQLSLFVSQGQIEMVQWINADTKVAKGDAKAGKQLFHTLCVKCHDKENSTYPDQAQDADGNSLEELAALSRKNPWETLHKIRVSQPAAAMPALLSLDVQQQVDIVRYLQDIAQ